MASPAFAISWEPGDVFIGRGGGYIRVYDSSGVFKQQLYNGYGGQIESCAFSASGDLYTLDGIYGEVVKFSAASQTPTPFASVGLSHIPKDLLFANNGNLFVSSTELSYKSFSEFDSAGQLLQTHLVAYPYYLPSGPYGMDLAADQYTMYYSSDGSVIRRYDLSTDTWIDDFASLNGATAVGVKLIKSGTYNGQLLVATGANIEQLDSTGGVVQTYDATGEDSWYHISLDPTNNSVFWATGRSNNKLYKFTLGTPSPTTSAFTTYTPYGICVMPGTVTPTPTPTNTPIATPTCVETPGWCTSLSPNPGTALNELRSVAVISENNIWAVGDQAPTGQPTQALVQHWDGSNWTTASVSDPSVGRLNGVAFTSDQQGWAVGDNGSLSWQGSSWNRDSGLTIYPLNAIAAQPGTSEAWAVGNGIAHHISTSWVTVQSPDPNATWTGVALSNSRVWIVGYAIEGSDRQPVMYSRSLSGDNPPWELAAPPLVSSDTYWASVDLYDDNNVWVVGATYDIGSDIYDTITERCSYANSTTTCTAVASPNPGVIDNRLNHVFVTFPGDVWAVGSYYTIGRSGNYTLILHWDGYGWQELGSPYPGVDSVLLGFSGASTLSQYAMGDWAVGYYTPWVSGPQRTLVEQFVAPSPVPRTTSYYVQSVDLAVFQRLGCQAAQEGGGIVFLDFGQPKLFLGGIHTGYGASTIDKHQHANVDEIEEMAKYFAIGFKDCEGRPVPSAKIAISINNNTNIYPDPEGGPMLTDAHAQEWAGMVAKVNQWLVDPNRQWYEISAAAGIDAEPNFDPANNGQLTRTWIDAYSATQLGLYYDFGSLDGRPCSGCSAWDAEQMYHVAWGSNQGRPVPQIYRQDWAKAWYDVKQYGIQTHAGDPTMYFPGALSGCASTIIRCHLAPPLNLPMLFPDESWRQLWLEHMADLPNRRQPINWSTTMIFGPKQ